MSVCTFFGHSECYGLDKDVLRTAIEDLIKQGITEFLVGNHGQFDGMVFSRLQDLCKDYPEISYSVALAYLPTHKQEYDIYHGHSFYPEGQEIGHIFDLLVVFTLSRVTTFYRQEMHCTTSATRVYSVADDVVQFPATALFNLSGQGVQPREPYSYFDE